MGRISLTQGEYDKIKAEYERMKRVDRPEIIQAISDARDHGDLSENAEYSAAKEKQIFVEARISRYEGILGSARVVQKSTSPNSNIHVGSQVTLRDLDDNEEEEYLLTSAVDLGIHDVETISTASPVGKALIGKSVGDKIEIPIPNGKIEYEIIGHKG